MSRGFLITSLLLIIINECYAQNDYSHDVKALVGCNEFVEEYKKLSEQKRIAVCNCGLEKLDSNDWSSEKKCLLKNLSEEDGLLEKCNIESREGEIKIFRPFLEKLIELSSTCYKVTTGVNLYPSPRS